VVLVDTSVWIRAGANRQPFAAELARLLELDQVVGHDMVFGELLIGDSGGRRKMLEGYQRIAQAKTVPHKTLVEFVRSRSLQGQGLSWIDVHLLASALVQRLALWTADGALEDLAGAFGIRYQPRK
jgi:predicted nucleic acid-binding protein